MNTRLLHFYRLGYGWLLTVGLLLSTAVTHATDVEQTASALFKSFTKTNPLATQLDIDPDVAIAVQEFYIALLRPTWGMDVGYAAQATHEDTGDENPPTGILLENMFTGTRAIINRSLGINMQAAAELYFRVKSANLNQASSRTEALMTLQSVIPGVRLSDARFNEPVTLGRPLLSAANLEVRMCVLGGALELDGDAAWIDRLANFSVMMLDQDQQLVAQRLASRSVHPLDAVLATRDALLQRGIHLSAGDILAVGTLTDGYSVANLSRLRVDFAGLSEEQPVFVYMGFR